MKIPVKVRALPGFTVTPFDGSSVLVMDSANNSRNVIVDINTVRQVLDDLTDGRPDAAAHFGYGEFWTLAVA